jgi:hypothetical protein
MIQAVGDEARLNPEAMWEDSVAQRRRSELTGKGRVLRPTIEPTI